MRCRKCGSKFGRCAECGKIYRHGTASHCIKQECVQVNSPIDCVCGLVVSQDKKGVLDFEMNLHTFIGA